MREQRAFREMTEALRPVRNSRSEKSGVRRHDHRVTSVNSFVCSEAEYEMVEDEDAFVERHRGDKNKLVRKFGDIDFSKMHVSLEKSDR